MQERGEAPGIDPESITVVLQVAALLEETVAEALIVPADGKGWDRVAQALEARFADLLEIGQPVNQTEQTYRHWLEAALISPAAEELRTEYSLSTSGQFTRGGPGGPGSVPDTRLRDPAVLLHTYGFATITQTESSLTYEASIRIDDGLTRHLCCDEPPAYEPPLEGTWEQTDPVFELVVHLEDTDEDGAWDQLTCTGSAMGVALADLHEAAEVPLHGHLLSALGNLVFCDY